MEQKKKISGTLVCLLALAVVLAAYYATVFTSLSGKTAALQAQHDQNMLQLSADQSMLAQKANMQKAISDLQTKIKQSSRSLGIPASRLGPDIQKGLSSAGVTPTSVTTGSAAAGKKTASGKALTQVPVTITADCTIDQLTALLHYFEKGTDAVYVVNTVSTAPKSAQDGSAGAGDYAVTVNMTAYCVAGASSGSGS